MNEKINKEITNEIYEEILVHKLDIVHECISALIQIMN
jgi:hypothetical protein